MYKLNSLLAKAVADFFINCKLPSIKKTLFCYFLDLSGLFANCYRVSFVNDYYK